MIYLFITVFLDILLSSFISSAYQNINILFPLLFVSAIPIIYQIIKKYCYKKDDNVYNRAVHNNQPLQELLTLWHNDWISAHSAEEIWRMRTATRHVTAAGTKPTLTAPAASSWRESPRRVTTRCSTPVLRR